jgi:hypothetical protein
MGRAAVEVTSYRRDDGVTAKRGECVLEEAEVRREAWYVRLGAWKTAEGDEEAEMVGDDEASMSRLQGGARLVLAMSDRQAGGARAKVAEGDAHSDCLGWS